MAAQLKQRYRYLGVMKQTILDALAGIDDVSIAQRQEMVALAERRLGRTVVKLKPKKEVLP
jgi:SOS response regulatory protein OraA/RecX